MRYVWEMYHEYFGGDQGWIKRTVIPPITNYLRNLGRGQRRAGRRVHRQLAPRRPPYPQALPASLDGHQPAGRHVDVRPLRPDRRLLPDRLGAGAVQADRPGDRDVQTGFKLPLKIVGIGEHEDRLAAMAGPTVEMLGWPVRRRGPRTLPRLPRVHLPAGGGLRHHPAGGPGVRQARDRLRDRAAALETVVGAFAEDGRAGRYHSIDEPEAATVRTIEPPPFAGEEHRRLLRLAGPSSRWARRSPSSSTSRTASTPRSSASTRWASTGSGFASGCGRSVDRTVERFRETTDLS